MLATEIAYLFKNGRLLADKIPGLYKDLGTTPIQSAWDVEYKGKKCGCIVQALLERVGTCAVEEGDEGIAEDMLGLPEPYISGMINGFDGGNPYFTLFHFLRNSPDIINDYKHGWTDGKAAWQALAKNHVERIAYSPVGHRNFFHHTFVN
jgi:hypothetical protein